jgi:hypothetical protein
MMLVTAIIFAVMAYHYKYMNFEREYELSRGEDQADLVNNMENQSPDSETPIEAKPEE